jgi:predicted aldo/keto reductase-like oxidoreductase
MIYKQFQNLRLSWLGMGAMRLPSTGQGYGSPIDQRKAMELIEYAYEHGVNYYDTGYFYHGGESERFIGKVLTRFPRDSWYLASKMPGSFMRFNDGKLEVTGFNMDSKVFSGPADVIEFKLKKCGVDYFDFYLLHNVSESTYDFYTNEKLNIIDCLIEQKTKGRIRHLGFSSHGRPDTIANFLKYLDARNCNDFEFAMIQLNYLDWTLQEAREKYDIITKHSLPVFIMEPMRGGKLANLGSKADVILKSAHFANSQASLAFRYLQSLDNIPVILSGMSSMEQLKENLSIFSKHAPLTQTETALLQQIVENITERVPCTSCRYCVEACPKSLDIPMLLTLYNEAEFEVGWFLEDALRAIKEDEKPLVGAAKQCAHRVLIYPR